MEGSPLPTVAGHFSHCGPPHRAPLKAGPIFPLSCYDRAPTRYPAARQSCLYALLFISDSKTGFSLSRSPHEPVIALLPVSFSNLRPQRARMLIARATCQGFLTIPPLRLRIENKHTIVCGRGHTAGA